MSSEETVEVNGIKIDLKKANELLNWLILTEKRNAMSRTKSDPQMVAAIQKRIEEVVECY